MRNGMKKVLILMAIALPLMMGVPNATAIITTWDYHIDYGWSAFAPAGPTPAVTGSVPGTFPPGCVGPACLPSTLSWGTSTGTGQSQLILSNATNGAGAGVPVTGSVVTNGPFVPDVFITHANQPILGFDQALVSATVTANLLLTPTSPPGSQFPAVPAVQFLIAFKETLNLEPCASPSPGNPCNDIFVLLNPASLHANFVGPDGVTYGIDLNILGLHTLLPAECAAAGQPAGCVGEVTAEGLRTTIPTEYRITANVIPEPSTLLLLGSGLAAIALYRRKSAKV